jgi:hypothetical protein
MAPSLDLTIKKDGNLFGPHTPEEIKLMLKEGTVAHDDLVILSDATELTVRSFLTIRQELPLPQEAKVEKFSAADYLSLSEQKRIELWEKLGEEERREIIRESKIAQKLSGALLATSSQTNTPSTEGESRDSQRVDEQGSEAGETPGCVTAGCGCGCLAVVIIAIIIAYGAISGDGSASTSSGTSEKQRRLYSEYNRLHEEGIKLSNEVNDARARGVYFADKDLAARVESHVQEMKALTEEKRRFDGEKSK